MNNLPILLKIEKTLLNDYQITIYNQLNGITQDPEIIFIKRDNKHTFNYVYEEYNFETIKRFVTLLNNTNFI